MSAPKIEKNNVKNRFLPIPETVAKGLEPEPKITDFQIVKELGAGSFGHVYLVTHKATKAQYAIKAIDKRNKENYQPEIGGNRNAIDLLRQINDMNHGKYLNDTEPYSSTVTNFH